MEATFSGLLKDYSWLFQKVLKIESCWIRCNYLLIMFLTSFNISRCKFSSRTKVNSNKFTLIKTTHIFIFHILHAWILTKREELSFRIVFAFPNASIAGLAWMIWSSSVPYFQIIFLSSKTLKYFHILKIYVNTRNYFLNCN